MLFAGTRIEISRLAVRANAKTIAAWCATPILFVVKSNAYGHGVTEILKCLRGIPRWGFGVATIEEGLQLRKEGVRDTILVLTYANPAFYGDAVKNKLALVCSTPEQIRLVSRAGKKFQRRVSIHLKFDTGTGRFGAAMNQTARLLRECTKHRSLRLAGTMTHFADAENDPEYTELQCQRFKKVFSFLSQNTVLRHAACTAAALRFPKTRYDLVRIGIGLYGLYPSDSFKRFWLTQNPDAPLKPVLTWKTSIAQIKRIMPGETVGYGRTFRAKQAMRLAILPVGYWDGLDHRLSNRGLALCKGKQCRIVGRISMNACAIDCSMISASPGDEVVLLGRQGREVVTVNDLAERIGTHVYEVVTRLNPATPRRIV